MSSPNKPEPPPKPNSSRPIWELVVEDMEERDREGRKKYGAPLQAFNGRDPLVDAYQEALDLAVYLRQAMEERGRPHSFAETRVFAIQGLGFSLRGGKWGVKDDEANPGFLVVWAGLQGVTQTMRTNIPSESAAVGLLCEKIDCWWNISFMWQDHSYTLVIEDKGGGHV